MITDDKIRDEKLQYDINREASFAKIMSKNISKNISKSLSRKYSQKLLS